MADETSIKTDILLKAFELSQDNYRDLQARAQTIVSWIGSLLLATMGVIAALGSGKIASLGTYFRVGLTIAICSLFVFAWITEIMLFRARVAESKAGARIVRVLHLFNAGYFDDHTIIFDEKNWTQWMNDPLRKCGVSPGTAVLFVLAALVVVFIWMS